MLPPPLTLSPPSSSSSGTHHLLNRHRLPSPDSSRHRQAVTAALKPEPGTPLLNPNQTHRVLDEIPQPNKKAPFYAQSISTDGRSHQWPSVLSSFSTMLYASWQFNMKDFDPQVDDCSEASIEFLKKSGIDFDKNRRDGVRADILSKELVEKLVRGGEGLKWITFHGMYDLAYLIKIVYQMPLPDTLAGFLRLVRKLFGTRVYDLKYMVKEYDAFLSEVGLVRLSRMLEIEWRGSSHQAGHDSLLTAMAFWKMKREFSDFDEGKHAGILYGFEEHAEKELDNVVMPCNHVVPARIALSRSCAPVGFHPVPRPYAYRDVFPPGYDPTPRPPYAYRVGFPVGYHPFPRPYRYCAVPPEPSFFVSA